MDKTEFYAECDRLLGQQHPPPRVYRYRGRWGPRCSGPGRYEGHGLIRYFGPNHVHIALYAPIKVTTVTTPEDALRLIESLII